jgi:hypothetical protein
LSFDFVEFTKARVSTFYEDKAVHVDMSNPLLPGSSISHQRGLEVPGDTRGRLRLYERSSFGTHGPDQNAEAVWRRSGHDRLPRGGPDPRVAFLMLRLPLRGHQRGLRHEGGSFEPNRSREPDEGLIRCVEGGEGGGAIARTLEKLPEERPCSCKDSLRSI